MTAMLRRGTSAAQLHRVSPADPTHAANLRRELDDWLRRVAVPEVSDAWCADVLLGANEALASCAEHAYSGRDGGSMTMQADIDAVSRLIRVSITDQGNWRQSRPACIRGSRGRGIALMHTLAGYCNIDRGVDGISVRLDYEVPPTP